MVSTWLAEAGTVFGIHLESISPMSKDFVVAPIDLLSIAALISRRGVVPGAILEQLDFMLKLRGDWDPRNYKRPLSQANEEEEEEAAHQHFVTMSTLRMIRKFLSLGRDAATAKEELRSRGYFAVSGNPTVPEGPGVPGGSSVNEEPGLPKARKIRLENEWYNMPELPGEAFFGWVCFFNDLLVMRTYLKAYWHGYLQSFETLSTRALVTNAAIRSIRDVAEIMLTATKCLPDFPEDNDITSWVFSGITGRRS
ncbi:hypothetical protein F5Y14DRAFT_427368 [Nemania sp. NC0429]|nr:hypothetical protein F5Y14DRAFT_427368 [Nemania sp. NC0429]